MDGISNDVVGALREIKTAIENVSQFVTATTASVKEQSEVTEVMSTNMKAAAVEAASI